MRPRHCCTAWQVNMFTQTTSTSDETRAHDRTAHDRKAERGFLALQLYSLPRVPPRSTSLHRERVRESTVISTTLLFPVDIVDSSTRGTLAEVLLTAWVEGRDAKC